MNEDLEAIRRVVEGDVDVFRVLVERHQASVLALTKNLMPDASDGEDVAQEAFLAAYLNLATFDPERGSFTAWLFRIARNLSLNALKRRRPVPLDAVREAPAPEAAMSRPERDELWRTLDRALAELRFEQRSAFVLREIHGLTYEEIATIEQVELGTVKSRLGRARERLRSCLTRRKEGSR